MTSPVSGQHACFNLKHPAPHPFILRPATSLCRRPHHTTFFFHLPSEIDRVVQRSMFAADQHPVGINLTGITLLNNFWGSIMMLSTVWFSRRSARGRLTKEGIFWIVGELCCGHSHLLLGSLGAEPHLCHEFLGPRVLQQIRHNLRRGLFMGSRPLCYVCAGHPQQLWAGRCAQVRRQPQTKL